MIGLLPCGGRLYLSSDTTCKGTYESLSIDGMYPTFELLEVQWCTKSRVACEGWVSCHVDEEYGFFVGFMQWNFFDSNKTWQSNN